MTKQTYNINELLELRKHLEEKYGQMLGEVNDRALVAITESLIEHANGTEKILRADEKKTLEAFTEELTGVQDEIAKVKTTITTYNAEKLKGLLYQREAVRNKIALTTRIRNSLPLDPETRRKVLRQGKDGEALESHEIHTMPLFTRKEVDKLHDNYAKEERKLNTEIQRLNLNEKIELD